MSPETDDVTIELGNVDGGITEIFNTVEMELAEVTLIRYYPDIDEAIDPLWVGWGGTIRIDEVVATWRIHFGFRGFTQKGLRKIVTNCWKIFRDGVYCPYDPNNLDNPIGSAAILLSVGINDSVTVIPTTNDGLYKTGDLIQIDDEIMLVTAESPLTVIRGYKNTTPISHAAPAYVEHKSCTKYLDSCIRRFMDGPLNSPSGLRYFGGWEKYYPPSFWAAWVEEQYPKVGLLKMAGNPSVWGRVIPVVYGEYKMDGVPCIFAIDAAEFQHSLFIVSEGMVNHILVPISVILVNDLPIDNVGPYTATFYRNESCMIWEGGVGQRISWAASYGVWCDQYGENPYLINTAAGAGPSLSDVFAVRIRTEEGGDDVSKDFAPTMNIQFAGKIVRTIQGWIDNDPSLTTSHPDPIEAAVDYCVNGKFGPRLDITRINLTQAKLMSDYCRELINNVAAGHEGEQNDRFMFNGILQDDQSVEAHLNSILENCNGYYIPDGKQLFFGIRKAEDLVPIDAMVVISDTGTDRNILRENGKSTLVVEQTAATDGYANNMEVNFADREYGFQSNKIYIFDEEMQLLAANIVASDITRTVNTKQLSLVGTSSQDQAQRLGVLRLREEYLRRFKYTFKMSLKDSIGLTPGDVRKLETLAVAGEDLKRLSYKATYIRIWSIIETDEFTASIEAYKHDNDYYDNEV
jgi:hypothetical protein